jgi:hypothetical protein
LTEGYQLSFLIGAALVVIALVVAATVLQPERRAMEEVQSEAKPADCEAA